MLLSELATWLNDYLQVNRFGQDCNGIYRNSNRPLRRLGLALQSDPTLLDWIQAQQLDDLLLHCSEVWGLHCLRQIRCKHYLELQVWVREPLG